MIPEYLKPHVRFVSLEEIKDHPNEHVTGNFIAIEDEEEKNRIIKYAKEETQCDYDGDIIYFEGKQYMVDINFNEVELWVPNPDNTFNTNCCNGYSILNTLKNDGCDMNERVN